MSSTSQQEARLDLAYEEHHPEDAGKLRLSEYDFLDPRARSRVREIEDQIAAGPLVTSSDERERLIAERAEIVVASMTPEEHALIEEVGLSASEPPIASPSQRRANLPPSAPTAASEQQLDALYAALRPEHAHRFQPEHETEAVELAEADDGRPFTRVELGIAVGVRARYGEGELTPRERRACEQIDREAEREQHTRELREMSERVDAQRREIERDTLNKIIRKRYRQGRSLVGAIQEADRITGRTAH